MNRMIRWLLCVFTASLASGCMSVSQPKVLIESVEIVGQQDSSTALLFHGRIENPHGGTLRLLQYNYNLTVQGKSVYHGRQAAGMTLIGGSERQFTLPAAFTNTVAGFDPAALPDASQWSLSGSLQFIGDSVFAETLREMGYEPTVGFSGSGTLQWPASR